MRNLYLELLHGPNGKEVVAFIKAHSTTPCDQARELSHYRKIVRIYTRSRGSYLAERAAQMRDLVTYGHKNGPEFGELVDKEALKITKDPSETMADPFALQQKACSKVEASATRSNKSVDKFFGHK